MVNKNGQPATTVTSSYRKAGADGRVRDVPAPAPREITVNGKYVLERRLGCGGMAEVFLARTVGVEGFWRHVALKRVLEAYSDNPKLWTMFVSEAQITSRLQHPNIVSVSDFDREADGRLFLVMELIDGVDLSKLIQSGPLPFSVVVHVAIEILRGLAYAHDLPKTDDDVRGVVHRDLSPNNVLVSWEGEVKISDFGIAKMHAESHATASAIPKGKPMYMSPEQVNGRPLDGRSDLFAFGAMLFELLCLRPLFSGESYAAIVGQVMQANIPDPRKIRREIPEDLVRVVLGLLRRDPADRTQKAELAIEALAASTSYAPMGREQLVMLLAQRFADRAPIRASAARLAYAAPTLLRRPAAVTVPGTPGAPLAVERPAVGQLPAAGTQAMPTSDLVAMSVSSRRRWPRPLVASVLVFAVGGAVSAAVIKATSEQPIAPTPMLQPTPSSSAMPSPPPNSPPLAMPSSIQPGSGSAIATAPAPAASAGETLPSVAAAPAPAPPSGKTTAGAPVSSAAKDRARPPRRPAASASNSSTESEGLGVLQLSPPVH